MRETTVRPATILLVDDQKDLLETQKRILEPFGKVLVARNVKDAEEIAKKESFDVAIVDVRLPDGSGVELMARLRELRPASEVVLITGFASVDAAMDALRSGAFAFILKSFRPEELIDLVEQALSKVRLRSDDRRVEEDQARVEVNPSGELALGLAHEIRNPLNAAVLQLHLLEREIGKLPVSEETKEALTHRSQIVLSEMGRLNRLVTEFLELARPHREGHLPVDVGALVGDIVELERERAEHAGIRFERDIAKVSVFAPGDVGKLKQVVINLVVNAIEAVKDGGVVTARVRAERRSEKEGVLIEVADNGPGIAAENIANVFDPFFTTKAGGTGLGLAIVERIVTEHQGMVEVKNIAPRGLAARVWLPSA